MGIKRGCAVAGSCRGENIGQAPRGPSAAGVGLVARIPTDVCSAEVGQFRLPHAQGASAAPGESRHGSGSAVGTRRIGDVAQLADGLHRPVPHEERGIGRSRIDAGAVRPVGRTDIIGIGPAEGVVAKHRRGPRPDRVEETRLVGAATRRVDVEFDLLQERARVTLHRVGLGCGGRHAIVEVAPESPTPDVVDLAVEDIVTDVGQVIPVPRT